MIIAFLAGGCCYTTFYSWFYGIKVEFAAKSGQKTTIKTKRLILRQSDKNDRFLMVKIFKNPEIMQTLSGVESFSDKEIDFTLNNWTESIKNQRPFGGYLAYEKKSGKFVGYVSLDHIAYTRPDRAEISYALFKEFRGKGYGFEMAYAIMKHMVPKALKRKLRLPNDVPLRAVTGTAIKNNTASKKILEKLGFEFLHDTQSHRYIYHIER
jgi:RimJ/RimL family protein N-acetyltransferase